LLDTHRYLDIFNGSLHVALSLLAWLATALDYPQADDYAHMRHLSIRLPKVRGAGLKRRQLPTHACRDPGCGCCARWREVA